MENDTPFTPKYTQWVGQYGGEETVGLFKGVTVTFETPHPMTFNECKEHLKENKVMGEGGRIYHLLGRRLKDS